MLGGAAPTPAGLPSTDRAVEKREAGSGKREAGSGNRESGIGSYSVVTSAECRTWIALAAEGGIHTLPGALLSWRDSDDNIRAHHAHDAPAKFDALLGCARWIDAHLRQHPPRAGEPSDELILRLLPRWFFRQVLFLGLGFDDGRTWAAVAALADLGEVSRAAPWARIAHAELRRRRQTAQPQG